MMKRGRSIAIVLALLVAIAGTLSARDAKAMQPAHGFVSKVELRILARQFDRGLPRSFTFVFVNRTGHQLRMPRPTQCIGGNGTVILRSQLKPLNAHGVPSGGAGGCAAGHSGKIQVLEWAKSWQSLEQGESLSVTYA